MQPLIGLRFRNAKQTAEKYAWIVIRNSDHPQNDNRSGPVFVYITCKKIHIKIQWNITFEYADKQTKQTEPEKINVIESVYNVKSIWLGFYYRAAWNADAV